MYVYILPPSQVSSSPLSPSLERGREVEADLFPPPPSRRVLSQVTFQTELGQLIDLITAPEDSVDLSKFSLEK